jgi:hypothetical protein
VKASYTCLSYVWGSEKIQRQILVNGKLLSVRENLYDFMCVARSKYANPQRTLWIDALCIDQGSALCIDQRSVLEKNHQVAQMGSIYANSVEVWSWLGFSESIGRAFAFGLELKVDSRYRERNTSDDSAAKWLKRNDQTNGQLKRDWLTVVADRYWTRAWITQEILLAPRVRLLVNDSEIDPVQISGCAIGLLSYVNGLEGDTRIVPEKWDAKTRVFETYMLSICNGNRIVMHNKPKLIELFNLVPGRQSHYAHDRVYSLLSLASDTSSIKVDYRVLRSELLRQILSIYKTTLCICAWFYMADMLDCYETSDPTSHKSRSSGTPVFKLSMKPVQTEFFMGENMEDWKNTCSECSTGMPSFDEKQQTTFCIKSICRNVRRGHLYVNQNKRGKYEIRRSGDMTGYEVLHFQAVKLESSKDDIQLGWGTPPGLYNVYLTGNVLMKLFQYPAEKARQAVPLEICVKPQSDTRNMELS